MHVMNTADINGGEIIVFLAGNIFLLSGMSTFTTLLLLGPITLCSGYIPVKEKSSKASLEKGRFLHACFHCMRTC